MAFLEAEFPRIIALMAVGGPNYFTNVNMGFSGYEQRNQNWVESRGEWDVQFVAKPQSFYDPLQAFFHAAHGKANGFRLFWAADYQATGEFIGTGDDATVNFQLQKTYTFPLSQYAVVRPIQKPIMSTVVDYTGVSLMDTVVVYVTRNGVTKVASGYGFVVTVDATTGIITFSTPPNSAAYNSSHGQGTLADIITADFMFDWPVRFDVDILQPKLITPRNGTGILYTVDGLHIKEVRIPIGQSAG